MIEAEQQRETHDHTRLVVVDDDPEMWPFVQRIVALITIGVDNGAEVMITESAHRVEAMLRSLSTRLRTELYEIDIVTYSGVGERTMVATLHTDEEITAMIDTVEGVLAADRTRRVLNYSGIHPRVGIAMCSAGGTAAHTLHDNAIEAPYTQRGYRDGRYRFRPSETKPSARKTALLESRLRKAVSDRALDLVVQPYYDLADDTPRGGEVLLRWRDEALGDVSPCTFIPILEQNRLIIPVTEWIVEAVARLQDELTPLQLEDFQVSFNVSPVHLQCPSDSAKLVDTIMDTCNEHDTVVVEITESTFISNADNTVRTLQRLKDIGARVALDDFGAGYSSMSYLVRFGFDLLKIDRALVSMIGVNPRAETVVSAVIAMARKLDIGTVAEGVETSDQRTMLRALGCDLAQGYYYAKPIPICETAAHLSRSGT